VQAAAQISALPNSPATIRIPEVRSPGSTPQADAGSAAANLSGPLKMKLPFGRPFFRRQAGSQLTGWFRG
jgi:hypothetical protein